jgi:hypothetical protein
MIVLSWTTSVSAIVKKNISWGWIYNFPLYHNRLFIFEGKKLYIYFRPDDLLSIIDRVTDMEFYSWFY